MKAYFIWLLKLITLIVVFFVIVPALLIGVISGMAQGSKKSELLRENKQVAVVEVSGVIMDSKDVIQQLYHQARNDSVKGIVLRVDSPGGAVGPSQEIYTAVRKLKEKKPIVASFGTVAASGGLYSALGASKILCQPGTLTGSIGVLMQIPNFRRITQWVGVDVVTVKSGALKDVGNSFRDMTPEELSFVQNTVNDAHQAFVDAVADARGIQREEVLKFADGRILLGSQAAALRLVDGYGDVYDAGRLVFDLLGEPLAAEEQPVLFYPEDKLAKFRKFLEAVVNLPAVFNRSPRLVYLAQVY